MSKAFIVACAMLSVSFTSQSQTAASGQPTSNTRPGATNAQGATEVARLNALVNSLYRQRKYDEALPHALRVVELLNTDGDDRRALASALFNLGILYSETGKHGEGLKNLRRMIELYDSPNSGVSSETAANALERIGFIEIKQRDYGAAEKAFRRSLTIKEEKFGRTHRRLLTPLLKIAELSQARGRKAEAELAYSRVLDFYEAMTTLLSNEDRQALESYECAIVTFNTNAKPQERTLFSRLSAILSTDPNESPSENLAKIQDVKESGHVLNGKALKLPAPAYPEEAKRERATGTIIVKVLVNEAGSVVTAEPRCGHPSLQRAAADSARLARFSPTVENGVAVKVIGVINYNFTLQ